MTRTRKVAIALLGLLSVATAQFKCPENRGFFPDPEQCDLYFACVDGVAEEKLCKDGLVFRDDNPKKELCDIPANVECGERTALRKNYFVAKLWKKAWARGGFWKMFFFFLLQRNLMPRRDVRGLMDTSRMRILQLVTNSRIALMEAEWWVFFFF